MITAPSPAASTASVMDRWPRPVAWVTVTTFWLRVLTKRPPPAAPGGSCRGHRGARSAAQRVPAPCRGFRCVREPCLQPPEGAGDTEYLACLPTADPASRVVTDARTAVTRVMTPRFGTEDNPSPACPRG